MAQEGALVRDYLDKSTRPIPLPGGWVGFQGEFYRLNLPKL